MLPRRISISIFPGSRNLMANLPSTCRLLLFLHDGEHRESQSSLGSLISFDPMQVFGLLTKPLVRLLLPSSKHLTGTSPSEPSTPKSFTWPLLESGQDPETDQNDGKSNVPRPTSLRMLLSTPSYTVHNYWRKFDDAFMRPVFGGRGFMPYIPISPSDQNDDQWH